MSRVSRLATPVCALVGEQWKQFKVIIIMILLIITVTVIIIIPIIN